MRRLKTILPFLKNTQNVNTMIEVGMNDPVPNCRVAILMIIAKLADSFRTRRAAITPNRCINPGKVAPFLRAQPVSEKN
jgi:hypothetical protein